MDITSEVIADFRIDKEGFADSTKWPDKKLKRALMKADKETGSSRWGAYSDLSLKQEGMFAYAAHYLTMSKAASTTTARGGVASAVGSVSSKSVGDESISFAVAGAATVNQMGESWLTATAYGQEFKRLQQRAGTGATCV
ncbi:head completion adaptor protein [Vibrio phage vB_VpM-pA2SJ1]|uniref:Head completion adaptor protein n=1 Tax=Vibrio phage vB_VpM-pA2SJ1 TaxID=3095964 RepID=A0AAX4J591_9CAUD